MKSDVVANLIEDFADNVCDPAFARGLRTAQEELTARGLVHAARWAAEVLVSLPHHQYRHPCHSTNEDRDSYEMYSSSPGIRHYPSIAPQSPRRTRPIAPSAGGPSHFVPSANSSCRETANKPSASSSSPSQNRSSERSRDIYSLAKAYFDLKQYRRCAGLLTRARELEAEQTGHHERADATFLRCHALYLSIEKDASLNTAPDAATSSRANADLRRLRADLGTQDEPYCLYLLAVIDTKIELGPSGKRTIQSLLIRSLAACPWNWDAWKRLASTTSDPDEASHFLEEIDREATLNLEKAAEGTSFVEDAPAVTAGRCCFSVLFYAWACLENDSAEEAREVFSMALSVLEFSSLVKTCLASCLYQLRLFDEAQDLFEEVFADDEFCLDGVDTFSNILYVKEDKVRLSVLAHRCVKIDKYCVETCCVVGNYYSLRGQHEQAVIHFQRALKLNRSYLSAWTLMGHEYVEMKNTAAAVEAYRRAVDISPKDFRAWYGLGQTYELLEMPQYTLYYYSKAVALRPRDARMWCALGQTLEELSRLPDAVRAYERMKACDDREGLAISKLASLYELMTRQASAGDRKHNASMAAHYHAENLARRDKEGMSGPETAAALRFLAEHTVMEKRFAEAEQYCMRLLDYSPMDKDIAKKLLTEIHARRGTHALA